MDVCAPHALNVHKSGFYKGRRGRHTGANEIVMGTSLAFTVEHVPSATIVTRKSTQILVSPQISAAAEAGTV